MTWSRLAPLLLLPVAINAWAQDAVPAAQVTMSQDVLAGIGAAVVALFGIGGLITGGRWKLLLDAVGSGFALVGGRQVNTAARLAIIEAEAKRVRRAVGVQADPEEPAPGTGLLVDVARLSASATGIDQRLARVEEELAGLRVAVGASNDLTAGVLAALRAAPHTPTGGSDGPR